MALAANGSANAAPLGVELNSSMKSEHPFDETFDSVGTLECSFFTSADEEENVTVSLILDEEEEGLEMPINGSNYWAAKRTPDASLTIPTSSLRLLPLDPDEHLCIETTLEGGVEQDQPKGATATLDAPQTNVKMEPGAPPPDPVDGKCIETTLHGIEQDQPVKDQQDAGVEKEEGVEMNLDDFKKESRLVLLDLKGAEVATTGKKVRFVLDEKGGPTKTTASKSRGRKKLLHYLRNKKKSSSAGCLPLVQMAVEKETSTNEKDKEAAPPTEGADEKVGHQTDKLTGVVIELYDSFLKAVVESYVLCQYAGDFVEEQVLNYADTEFLRDLLCDDEDSIDVFGNAKEEAKASQNVETKAGSTCKEEISRHSLGSRLKTIRDSWGKTHKKSTKQIGAITANGTGGKPQKQTPFRKVGKSEQHTT